MVLAADQPARRAGLKPGMVASKAQALVANLILRDAEPEADHLALEKLATWMQRHYAPLVAVDPPAGLMLDATGVAHLFGGEADMLREIIGRLAEDEFDVEVQQFDRLGASDVVGVGAQETIDFRPTAHGRLAPKSSVESVESVESRYPLAASDARNLRRASNIVL